MTTVTNCPICGLALDDVQRMDGRDSFEMVCQRCGRYAMTGPLLAAGLAAATPSQRAGLMAAVRESTERDELISLRSDSWAQTALQFSGYSIQQKLRRLLEFVGDRSGGHAGTRVSITDELEYPRFAAFSAAEYHWLRRALIHQGLVEENGSALTLTMQGWEAYRPLTGGAPGTCFVAMAFDTQLNEAYEFGIVPAVTADCGFSIVRVDKVEHNGNINDKIIGDIRGCQFVVADFTLHRNGVYFEAGFAMGLGRPVVWICRRDHLPDAHFDTRPYNHVVWDEPADLREKLANRLRATILR